MTITTITSQELNQDVARARKAAKSGPVFIRDSTAGAGVQRSPLAEARGQLLLTESPLIAPTWLREVDVGVVSSTSLAIWDRRQVGWGTSVADKAERRARRA